MTSYLALVRLNILATASCFAVIILFYNIGGINGVQTVFIGVLLIDVVFHVAKLEKSSRIPSYILSSPIRMPWIDKHKFGTSRESDPEVLLDRADVAPPPIESSTTKMVEVSSSLITTAREMQQMSELLERALRDARNAAQAAERARKATEEIQTRYAQDYNNFISLAKELQRSIAALASLAEPVPPPASVSFLPSVDD